ncbi:MAG: S8 family serine peptidase [Cytophagales bacterium]|nr:S8 family serine peptidase [Bernardetiaceae bacterium]MDW8206044.1 S8 family serine peptidase [Cytophagales bacterium]
MKQKLLHYLAVLLFASTCLPLGAQVISPLEDKTNKARLEEIKSEAVQRFEALKNRLEELSKQPDWSKSRYAKYYHNGKVYGVEAILPDGTVLVNEINSNIGAANTTRANRLWTGGILGLNLNGEGTQFGVWEAFDTTPEGQSVAAVLPTHQELNGRVTIMDGATLPGGRGSNHATHVAGTLAATGVVPDAKGMASAAQILSYDVNNDAAEMAAAAANGLVISQHSYGVNASSSTEAFRGAYNVTAQVWDEIANAAPNYLMVKSAGNNGSDTPNPVFGNGYNVLTTSSNSKNVLVVANASIVNFYSGPSSVVIASSSSRGPTDDGRIKPDITGAGVNIYSPIGNTTTSYNFLTGTSMSGPNISGSAALLQQHWRNLFSGVPFRSATLRGLIIHTADEAGAGPGPDYIYGWGLMNAERAARLMSHVAASGTQHILQQNILNNGATFTTTVVASGNEPLRFTICWNDPAATGSNSPILNDFTPRLRNDLDLRIVDNVTNQVFFPWTMPYQQNPANTNVATQVALQNADNNRDNVEQVVVFTPIPGRSYTVTVTHKGSLVGGGTGVCVDR